MSKWCLQNEGGDRIIVRADKHEEFYIAIKDRYKPEHAYFELTIADANDLITMLTEAIREAEKQKT